MKSKKEIEVPYLFGKVVSWKGNEALYKYSDIKKELQKQKEDYERKIKRLRTFLLSCEKSKNKVNSKYYSLKKRYEKLKEGKNERKRILEK